MVKTKKKLDVPLSGLDLKHLFAEMSERPNIILEKEIKPTWDIEKIFNGSGHATIFREYDGQETGHWVSIIRNHKPNAKGYAKEGQCLYFDSLGGKPSQALVDVVLKHYPKLLWNDKPYQKDDESSCGRWALAIASFNKLGLSPQEIEHLLDNTKDVNKFIINTFRNDD
jgi:hypothetical protein